MSASTKYLCAFRGRRDYYQIPLALAETDILQEFVTDAYSGAMLRRVAHIFPRQMEEKIRSRHEAGIPQDHIKCVWSSAVLEYLRHMLGFPPSVTFAKLDRQFGLAVAARARKTKSHLLIYSHYAWESFICRYQHRPRK